MSTTIARIANALIDNDAMLSLPRWRVMSDIRERFGCCESVAREAFALARVEGRLRIRRDTTPYARVERRAA